ncbi:MAG: ATP-binding cassette domain-containing protein [Chloroflexota bacterium]|nr:ATP-binding cassette domain-containing protein [Chloroflexota bacterium]
MANLIEITDLLIKRGKRVALEIQELSIPRGETVAVVGPNGAGKSTLLLALARLLKPASGEIRFDGKSLSEWNDLEYRRKIAFVFQTPLLMDMTVEQNVALGLKFRNSPGEDTRARVLKWMKNLNIEALAKRRADQLSGGEAQRVSLARAFVLGPELLLLDEPFSALDPPTRRSLIDDLKVLLSEANLTTVLVTHNLVEAVEMSRRVAIVVDGKLRQIGTPSQIKESSADEVVAEFLKPLPPRPEI